MSGGAIPHITIIGAGYSGAMVAYHLATQARRAITVDLLGDTERCGLGVAYGTPDPVHLLNVAAGRMSALPDVEDDFLQWLRRERPKLESGAFVPRMLFGKYVSERVEGAIGQSAHAKVRRVVGRAVAIRERRVLMADGNTLGASDAVVLALGNAAPDTPTGVGPGLAASGRYIASPWGSASGGVDQVGAGDAVVIVGTGLTMFDVVATLRSRGHRGGIVAVSRRGLLPQTHRTPSLPPGKHEEWPELAAWDGRALSLSRLVRARVLQARKRGVDWREVINSLRPITQQVWGRMPIQERRKFLRFLRPFWETHRHRAPDEVYRLIEPLMRVGTLRIVAGRIERASAKGGAVEVVVMPREGGAAMTIPAAWVVNCTGPQTDSRRIDDPLVRDLLSRGQIVADPLGLGIETAADGAVVGMGGRASEDMYTLGPWRRPALWETTAVPEIRGQAKALARTLLQKWE
ncbi:MAG: FAD/NAD(P)-binding protein [Phycisphaerales bacterium]